MILRIYNFSKIKNVPEISIVDSKLTIQTKNQGARPDLLDSDGDMGEWLVTEGVRGLLTHKGRVKQLPLPIGQIILKVNIPCPVGHINLNMREFGKNR